MALVLGDFTTTSARCASEREGAPSDTFAAAGVGTRPVAFNYNASQQYRSHGYPASSKFQFGARRCTRATRRSCGATAGRPPMAISCSMTGGSSGGGWVAGGAVASVNSYTYNGLKNVMHGPYQGAVAQRPVRDRGLAHAVEDPGQGFEPRFTAPEAVVLPLDEPGRRPTR